MSKTTKAVQLDFTVHSIALQLMEATVKLEGGEKAVVLRQGAVIELQPVSPGGSITLVLRPGEDGLSVGDIRDFVRDHPVGSPMTVTIGMKGE